MEGEPSLLSLGLILAGGAGVLVLVAIAERLSRFYRGKKRSIHCDTKGKDVDVVFVEHIPSGRVTGVRSCTAFNDPSHVTCGRDCVNLMNVKKPSDESEASAPLATKPR